MLFDELLADYGAGFWDFEEEEGEAGGQLEEGTESAAESAEADPPLQGGEEGSEEAETEGAVSDEEEELELLRSNRAASGFQCVTARKGGRFRAE